MQTNNPKLAAIKKAIACSNLEALKAQALTSKQAQLLLMDALKKTVHPEILEYLISLGCDLDQRQEGRMPINWAVMADDPEKIRVLVEADVSMDLKDAFGSTPLHLAITKLHTNSVKALLENGVDVESGGHYSLSPLCLAASLSSTELVKLFLQHHADPNKAGQDGITALMLAAASSTIYGRTDTMECLMRAGADPSLVNDRGHTAEAMAKEMGIRIAIAFFEYWRLQNSVDRSSTADTRSRNRL